MDASRESILLGHKKLAIDRVLIAIVDFEGTHVRFLRQITNIESGGIFERSSIIPTAAVAPQTRSGEIRKGPGFGITASLALFRA
jgi:hypothetical protein